MHNIQTTFNVLHILQIYKKLLYVPDCYWLQVQFLFHKGGLQNIKDIPDRHGIIYLGNFTPSIFIIISNFLFIIALCNCNSCCWSACL